MIVDILTEAYKIFKKLNFTMHDTIQKITQINY